MTFHFFKAVALFCLIVMSCFVCPVSAQKMTLQQLEAQLKQASMFEAQNKLEEALKLYSNAYAHYPTRSDIVMQMTLLLTRIGNHAETVKMLSVYLESFPKDLVARMRLGDAWINLGKPDSAYVEWQRIFEYDKSANAFALVADNFRKHNVDVRAADIYRQGRLFLKNPGLFAQEMAEIAERQARYDMAVREYLNLLSQRPQYRPIVEARLRDFGQAGDQQDAILGILSSEVRTHPGDYTRIGLFIEYALSANADAPALSLLLETSSLPENIWNYLFRIAQHALETDNFATAQKAYLAIQERTNRPDVQVRVLLGLAHTSEALHQPEMAKTHYNILIDRYAQQSEVDEARFFLSLLQRQIDKNPEASQQTLKDLIRSNRKTPWRYRALFELAEGHLQNSQFDQAQQAWTNILAERPNGPEASQARYHLIELQFLTGQIDTAQIMLKTLLVSEPNTDVTNDAIDLAALIQDGQQSNPALLKDFAHILLKTRQHKPEEALKALHIFQQNHSGSFLEDRTQFLQAQLQETLEQFSQAIQTYRQVIANMPWSPFCPGAQMAMARIYDLKLGQYGDAKKAYETVLTDYPLSLEADLVRERLRIIQQKIRELESKKEAG